MNNGSAREKLNAIAKVRKLLALSQSKVNPFESKLASQRMKQMMLKYGLTEMDLAEASPHKPTNPKKPAQKSYRQQYNVELSHYFNSNAIVTMRYGEFKAAQTLLSRAKSAQVKFDIELQLLDLFVRLKDQKLSNSSLEFRYLRHDFNEKTKLVNLRYPEYLAELFLIKGLYLRKSQSNDLALRSFSIADQMYRKVSDLPNSAQLEIKALEKEELEAQVSDLKVRSELRRLKIRRMFGVNPIEAAFLALCTATFLSLWLFTWYKSTH